MTTDDNKKDDATNSDNEAIEIPADFSLKRKIGSNITQMLDNQKVEKAKKTVAEIIVEQADSYMETVGEQLNDLERLCTQLSNKDGDSREILKEIVAIALSIKSNSGLYGYLLAGKIASSLYILAMKLDNVDDKMAVILSCYPKVLKNILKQNITSHENDVAKALLFEFYKISGTEADS